MNQPNLNQERMQALIQMVAKRTGMDPQALQAQVESGKLDQMAQQMNPQQSQQLNRLLSNPKELQRMMANPALQNMLISMMENQKK